MGLLFYESPEAGLGFGEGGEVLQNRHWIICNKGVDDLRIWIFITTDFLLHQSHCQYVCEDALFYYAIIATQNKQSIKRGIPSQRFVLVHAQMRQATQQPCEWTFIGVFLMIKNLL
jgi:hypothetical protein